MTLRLIGQGGTVPVREPVIRALANENLPVTLGWILAVLVAVVYAAVELYRWRAKRAQDLARQPLALVLVRIALITVVALGVTAILSVDRALAAAIDLAGIPYAVPLVVVLLLVVTFVLSRTSFGRHMYAVGATPRPPAARAST
ncbi:hypothetical protein [Blastococcus brunescens]|uniref:DUF2975 domain-containing protein n=1 Tax=Blastococcus brunescens TaxID=1564165 RepID=A0ABZ1ATT9_9ACTN|nr:hypothetical protein [Blastococcus sp. BMG 8361]WRL61992.1 hypothetical protein U6N30_18105 [Blastococcus sp. BMG 8361]